MDRVVFDTVILVRGLINPRSVCGRIVFLHAHQYQLVLSHPVLLEVMDVLQRPELVHKFRTLPGLDMRRVLDIVSHAEIVELPDIPAVSRDPNDDKFLATAAVAGAAYLVTEDEDLLVLKEYQGARIVTALGFLAVLEQADTG